MQPYGPWKIKSSQDVYRDPFVHVWLDQVIRPDEKPGQHVVVAIKPGVCVLAIDENRQVHLTQEFHYAVGRDSLEAVSGGVEPNENPDITAARELEEELGIVAAQLKFVTTVDPFTSVMVSPTRIYFATGLSKGTKDLEGTEVIETVIMPLKDAAEKVRNGVITHAPTCIAILMADADFD